MAYTTYGKSIKVHEFTWLSDASGDASVAINVDGELLRAVFVPGSATPTDGYDVDFYDTDSVWV